MVYINVSMPSISPSDLTFITSILHDILDSNIHFGLYLLCTYSTRREEKGVQAPTRRNWQVLEVQVTFGLCASYADTALSSLCRISGDSTQNRF